MRDNPSFYNTFSWLFSPSYFHVNEPPRISAGSSRVSPRGPNRSRSWTELNWIPDHRITRPLIQDHFWNFFKGCPLKWDFSAQCLSVPKWECKVSTITPTKYTQWVHSHVIQNKLQSKIYFVNIFFFFLNKKTTILFLTFHNCIVPMGFLPWEIRVALPGESQLRQSRAT